jgi:hypothetical protein
MILENSNELYTGCFVDAFVTQDEGTYLKQTYCISTIQDGYIFSLSAGRLWEIHMCSVKKQRGETLLICFLLLSSTRRRGRYCPPPPLLARSWV